jgi:CDP-diacylglycerol--glycerol-3-phosphate 3-phosphatidyltransferase
MPSIYDLKPSFQRLLRPMTHALAHAGVTPNQLTIAAMVFSIAAGSVVFWGYEARWPLLLIPVALLVRMALNAIDGMLAREHNMKTRLGAMLNELGDVLSDAVLYLPYGVIPGVSGVLLVPVVVLSVVSEMTGVLAIQIGAERRYDGPMGKSDRAFVFGLLALLLGLNVPVGAWVNVVLILMLVLLVLTIGNRARKALRESV